MTPPLFLVETDALDAVSPGSVVVVDGPEGRHAAGVMRLEAGESVLLSDGFGRLAGGVVQTAGRGRLTVAVNHIDDVPAPPVRYVVVQALARGGRDEAAVEAMTEVGVDEVLGWQAWRSVARWTDRTLPKWQAVSRAAVKQSRRAWLPVVAGPVSTAGVVERLRAAAVGVVLDAGGSVPLADVAVPDSGEVVIVVGPEGGLTGEEVHRFADAAAVRARLGTTVLRTSTAGVAALSVLFSRDRWA